MPTVFRLAAAVFSGLGLLVAIPSLLGEAPIRTRVTIRGTGQNVTIERTPISDAKPSEDLRLPPGPLGDAIRLKREGAEDAALIDYLQLHQAELPSVIDARSVRLLRGAGAGKSVTNFLATLAAVDLGPMGEGRRSAVFVPPPPSYAMAPPPYDAPYPYGVVGGYAPVFPRLPPRGFPHPRRMHMRVTPHRGALGNNI